MVERESPLGTAMRTGTHGDIANGIGAALTALEHGCIAEVTAWPGEEKKLVAALKKATGLALLEMPGSGAFNTKNAAFSIGPGRYLVAGKDEMLIARLGESVSAAIGTVTDLSHGRTGLRIAGPKAEWVLAKLFAIDFSEDAFPLGAGRATAHHEIFTQIQRSGKDQFDLYVFRSFARSFWRALCEAAEETGYEIKEAPAR